MAWDNNQMWGFYIWSTVGCASVLVLLYSATLVYLLRRQSVPFTIKLSILLIISNIGSGLEAWANDGITETIHSYGQPHQGFMLYESLQVIAEVMRDGCFSSAMWIFSFEYFTSASSIPYIFTQTPVP